MWVVLFHWKSETVPIHPTLLPLQNESVSTSSINGYWFPKPFVSDNHEIAFASCAHIQQLYLVSS
jgi:hypothetical protein